MRQREPDGAVDVALHQFVAALEPLVETFEHAARLIAGFARAFERDVIAARIGDDAEPALDQSEVLAVLPEQHGGEAIVVEGQNDLRRIVRRDEDRFFRSGCSQFRLLRQAERVRSMSFVLVACASAPNRLLLATSVMVTAAISPISDGGAVDLHRLQIRRAADQLAVMAARPLEQHVESAADAAAIERRLAAIDGRLQALQTFRFRRLRRPDRPSRRRACRAAANI